MLPKRKAAPTILEGCFKKNDFIQAGIGVFFSRVPERPARAQEEIICTWARETNTSDFLPVYFASRRSDLLKNVVHSKIISPSRHVESLHVLLAVYETQGKACIFEQKKQQNPATSVTVQSGVASEGGVTHFTKKLLLI